LFDAIEQTLCQKSTFINDLYEGSLQSVAQCLKCDNKSIKFEKFLDLSLPVRNEFEKIYNSSLEMALCNLLKPEKLQGDNQYYCEKCQKKVDAIKYISFEKLPKILILQFNRFDYDFQTESRKKIFDKVTFPQILNMNTFLEYAYIKV
jgi:ubiquitin carboxyl-terminal hydrolase 47